MVFSPTPSFADAFARDHDNFTLIRILLAAAVIISHSQAIVTGQKALQPWNETTFYTMADHAVHSFFAISGFLVAMSYQRRGGWLSYLIARALRLGPAFITVTLVAALVMGPLVTSLEPADYFSDQRVWDFIWLTLLKQKSVLALPGVFEDTPFYYVLATIWSLKWEMICYLGLLGLGMIGFLNHRRFCVALLAVIAIGMMVQASGVLAPVSPGGVFDKFLVPTPPLIVSDYYRLTACFLTGTLCWLYRRELPVSIPLAVLVFLLIAAALWFEALVYRPFLFIGGSYIILVLALSPALTHPRLTLKTDLSYGLYLYGWPIQQLWRSWMPDLAYAPAAIAALLTAGIAAYLSWTMVEKPSLDLKRRLLRRRNPNQRENPLFPHHS